MNYFSNGTDGIFKSLEHILFNLKGFDWTYHYKFVYLISDQRTQRHIYNLFGKITLGLLIAP